MARDLPQSVRKYAHSPVFTQATIPAALRHDHCTKASVWGLEVVSEGAQIYTRKGHAPQKVRASDVATIYPEELHHVAPDGNVHFQIEFYRDPAKAGQR